MYNNKVVYPIGLLVTQIHAKYGMWCSNTQSTVVYNVLGIGDGVTALLGGNILA